LFALGLQTLPAGQPGDQARIIIIDQRELPLSNPMPNSIPLTVMAAFRADLKAVIQAQRRLIAR
jgi:hypothetical protein